MLPMTGLKVMGDNGITGRKSEGWHQCFFFTFCWMVLKKLQNTPKFFRLRRGPAALSPKNFHRPNGRHFFSVNSKNKVAESIREHDENSIYFFSARSAKFFSTEPLHIMSSPFEMTLKLLIFKPKSETFPMVNFFEYQSSKSLNGVKKKKNYLRRA